MSTNRAGDETSGMWSDDEIEDHQTSLEWAATIGWLEKVKFLIEEEGVNPGHNDNETLRTAAYNGECDVVRFLLQHPSVDPRACNNDAVFGACRNVFMMSIEYIHEYGVSGLQYHIRKALETVDLLIQDHRINPSDFAEVVIHNYDAHDILEIDGLSDDDDDYDDDDDFNDGYLYTVTGYDTLLEVFLKNPRYDIMRMVMFALKFYSGPRPETNSVTLLYNIEFHNRCILAKIVTDTRVHEAIKKYEEELKTTLLCLKLPCEIVHEIYGFHEPVLLRLENLIN